MATPSITVLMPVFNGASYLAQAIDSVLRQTLSDFELLVVDDGSTDETASLLRNCPDTRLRVIRNARNLGVVASLNRGLEEATGEFVARMDADDLAMRSRLARQRDFLVSSPRVGLCGTWFKTFGGLRSVLVHPPTAADDTAARLFYESPLGHPTVMFRRALFEAHGLRYSHEYPHAEDFELWTRVAQVTELANLPEMLLRYREHREQVTIRRRTKQKESVAKILLRQLDRIWPSATPAEREAHVAIVANARDADIEVDYADSWLQALIMKNDEAGHPFPPAAFRRAIAVLWWRFCSSRSSLPGVIKAFYASDLARSLPLRNKIGMLAVRAAALVGRP